MGDLPSAVLFACTENTESSPLAEAILKNLHGRHNYVDSAGVRKGELDGFAVAVMDEIGIDISHHHPKTFEDLEDTSFDLVTSMSHEPQHMAVDMTRVVACDVEFWNSFDPSVVVGSREVRLEAYRQVRDELMRHIKKRFPVRPVADV